MLNLYSGSSRNRHFSFGSVTVKCLLGDGANKPPKSHNSSYACNHGDTDVRVRTRKLCFCSQWQKAARSSVSNSRKKYSKTSHDTQPSMKKNLCVAPRLWWTANNTKTVINQTRWFNGLSEISYIDMKTKKLILKTKLFTKTKALNQCELTRPRSRRS